MLTIHTLHKTSEHKKRMSTEELLLTIEQAVQKGETEFNIHASGQHDIGGPLWNTNGKDLVFHVTNPGQRVGAMALPKTEIIVEGSAPADVGWLNAGGRVIIKGDAGDTAGHCAASGVIYIGGRAGTRSGSLMKKDPLYPAPELWILKSVGSFSFEFMGGGIAIVCGCDSQTLASILGERPCVGMVGGTIYVRGPIAPLPDDCVLLPLESQDIRFLGEGLERFLQAIEEPKRLKELSIWKQWQKIVPASAAPKMASLPKRSLKEFREQSWVSNGIFSDVLPDSGECHGLLGRGIYRLRVPSWSNRAYQAPCEFSCPCGIPSQLRFNLLREGKTEEALRLVLDYTPFPASVCGAVCPSLCMLACSRQSLDGPLQVSALGLLSAETSCAMPSTRTGKRVAIIGGGVGGLSCAWQLARKGHDVTIFEKEAKLGGKMEQCIPEERLSHEVFHKEIARILSMGVTPKTNYPVNAQQFDTIRQTFDAVVVATGAQKKPHFPWPGFERVISGVDYLRDSKEGKRTKSVQHCIIIGCGNTAMDCAKKAYEM
ncbi:MAG: FAD-dependent oxidoreductase, partial [Desulfovibrio sp.]|nr:FAD-dependent oxidoreductase [Desulfovibrio sp.]